jgi:hypothetical protein
MAIQATPCSRRLMPRQQQGCSQLHTRKKSSLLVPNLRGCNAPYPLEDDDKPGAFPEPGAGKGEAYRTLVASEAPPRLVQEFGGGFRCTCLPSPSGGQPGRWLPYQ